jgi:hypothetical protein
MLRLDRNSENTVERSPLGEDVSELRGGRYEDAYIADGDTLADEVEVYIHMIRVLVLHRVGEVDHVDIVAVDECGSTREGACGDPGEADGTRTPRPCRWPQCILSLSVGDERKRRQTSASRTKSPGTRRSKRWTDACRNSRLNQHLYR